MSDTAQVKPVSSETESSSAQRARLLDAIDFELAALERKTKLNGINAWVMVVSAAAIAWFLLGSEGFASTSAAAFCCLFPYYWFLTLALHQVLPRQDALGLAPLKSRFSNALQHGGLAMQWQIGIVIVTLLSSILMLAHYPGAVNQRIIWVVIALATLCIATLAVCIVAIRLNMRLPSTTQTSWGWTGCVVNWLIVALSFLAVAVQTRDSTVPLSANGTSDLSPLHGLRLMPGV